MARTTTSPKRLEKTALCPCDSGLQYGVCCWDKAFQWVQSENGRIGRIVPLEESGRAVMKDALARFKELVGRAPRNSEPVFIEQWAFPDDDHWREFVDVAARAGSPPAVVYATLRTKRMVTEANAKYLTDRELEEWDEAIDEFYEQYDDDTPVQTFLDTHWDPEPQALLDSLHAAVCVLSNYMAGFKRKADKKTFCQLYMLARALETIRYVLQMIGGRYSEDALILIRSVYEASINISFVALTADAEEYFYGRSGLVLGSHKTIVDLVGKRKMKRILNVRTGHKTEFNISMAERVAATRDKLDMNLYSTLYSYLSGFAHSGFDPSHSMIENNKHLVFHRKSNSFEGLQWLFGCTFLLVRSLLRNERNAKWQSGDLKRLLSKMQRAFQQMVDASAPVAGRAEPLNSLAKRVLTPTY